MGFLIVSPEGGAETWKQRLLALDPKLDLRVWPETGPVEEVVFAMVWNHPPGALAGLPNLQCIASMGAGVDHVLRDPDLPAGVPITRVVDRSLVRSMTEYILLAVLHHFRGWDRYQRSQQARRWEPKVPPPVNQVGVGVMGLGQLGGDAALHLVELGFRVSGWSRRPKQLHGVQCFAGPKERRQFLAQCDMLICLLPLTQETRGILGAELFAQLPRGAYVINVGRGGHLVDDDLLAAVDSGQLSGACLDVFHEEPLPADHPFWGHPRIRVTPHVSSITNADAVAPQILANYRRLKAGRPLQHLVVRDREY